MVLKGLLSLLHRSRYDCKTDKEGDFARPLIMLVRMINNPKVKILNFLGAC